MRLDGKLDEPIYAATAAITGFVQQEPDEFKPATEKTEAWVFFDDDNIYVSARCCESHPERRVANEMRRDTEQLRQNDTFAVLFDTFHDRRNGYLFYANADRRARRQPGHRRRPAQRRLEHRVGRQDRHASTAAGPSRWRSRSSRCAISPARDQTWGINLRRVVRWKNEWSYLAQVPRALTTFRGILKISSAGTLVGLQAPSGSRNLEVKPYALAGVSTDRTVDADPVERRHRARVGGDVKYGITQNLTADLTINTDFAQVEVDEQQVNLTRFNLFFPEKRDFFLEGLGIFAFAGRASAGLGGRVRRHAVPVLQPPHRPRRLGRESRCAPAAALTGKAGELHVRRPQRADRRRRGRRGVDAANFTVLRAKRDILRRSSIGGMFTHRTATPGRVGSNDGYGVDATLSFYQNVRFDAYLAGTRSEGRDGDDLSYRGFFDYNADRYGLQARSPGRRAELSSGGRVRAAHRHAPQLRPGALTARGRQSCRTCASCRCRPASTTSPTTHESARHARARRGRSRPSSPTATWRASRYTDSFERLIRPFAIVHRRRRSRSAATISTPLQRRYTGGQQRRVSGEVVFEAGTFYNGDRQSIAVNAARMQVTPQLSLEPSLSINWVDLAQGAFTATVVAHAGHLHDHAADVRQRHRAVQLRDHARSAATSASAGNTGPAASCSSSTPTTTTRIRGRTSTRFATARSS